MGSCRRMCMRGGADSLFYAARGIETETTDQRGALRGHQSSKLLAHEKMRPRLAIGIGRGSIEAASKCLNSGLVATKLTPAPAPPGPFLRAHRLASVRRETATMKNAACERRANSACRSTLQALMRSIVLPPLEACSVGPMPRWAACHPTLAGTYPPKTSIAMTATGRAADFVLQRGVRNPPSGE